MKIILTVIAVISILVIGFIQFRNYWLRSTWVSGIESDAIWIARYIQPTTHDINQLVYDIIEKEKVEFHHKDWRLSNNQDVMVIGPSGYGQTIVIKHDKSISWIADGANQALHRSP